MTRKIYVLTGLFMLVFCAAQAIKAQEDVGLMLKELENKTDRFAKSFDNALDNSELNGTSTEGEVTRFVHDFEDSVDRLKKAWDKDKNARIAAQDTVARAKTIDKAMRKYKFDETTQTDWRSVKDNMARIAKVFKLKIKW
jgi:hypothetical protein